MKTMNDFTGLYPLQKTLRFELIPQGKTSEWIEKNGFLEKDFHRAQSYVEVKKIIDEYHKAFISEALNGLQLNELEDYYLYYQIPQKDETTKIKFSEIQYRLRKQIADKFTSHPNFKRIFAKELIKEDLLSFEKDEDKRTLIREFANFTTYFTGFHENRKNMYSFEEKATAIAYRLIHENLPRFIDNMRSFDKIRNTEVKASFGKILSDDELGPVIQLLTVDEMFQIEYFNQTLTQEGIYKYNCLIGGFVPEEGHKIQGLNEYINLYNQTVGKDKRLPRLKPLYKQILSDRLTASFLPDEFTSDNEVLESIEKLYREIYDQVIQKNVPGEHSLPSLLTHLSDFDSDGIFLKNDTGLTDISQGMFRDWSVFQKAVQHHFEANHHGKPRPGSDKYEELLKKSFTGEDSFSIGFLNQCVAELKLENHQCIENYFEALGKTEDTPDLFQRIETHYAAVRELLQTPYPADKKLALDNHSVDKIKALLDSLKDLQWFIRPLAGKGDEAHKDERFYGEFHLLRETLDQLTSLYNKVRNYMTQKPYSTEKIKLNFENSHFLSGWVTDLNSKAGLLFHKDNLFYLGIINNTLTKDEKDYLLDLNDSNESGNRIMLDFQKPDFKNIPRLFIRSKGDRFSPAVYKYNLAIDSILDIYDNKKFEVRYRNINEADYLKSLKMLIEYYKNGFSKHDSYKHFNFNWKPSDQYSDISEFYKDVEASCYQIKNVPVNWTRLIEYVSGGKLFLFQIYNKDFSPYSKGRPNMHTLYWKMLFEPDNLRDVVFKLNGEAEVFFRKSSIKPVETVVHPAGKPIPNKNPQQAKKESVFEYDIIKNRRYTFDKFQFHVPLTINFKATGTGNINERVNTFLKKETGCHVIGIDRGERHLLYLSLIGPDGRIIRQMSLNEILSNYNNETFRTDYHNLLAKKEKERDEARRSWKTIETIKELKEGYLSQVIHEVTRLMVEYQAIVVIEDLNMGFMRGRQKVEKQVYQKFEKMLIEKLNYLAGKDKAPAETGGLLQGYQLTGKFESFRSMGKQNGFLFYVPAWNTSKMDPVTGFVNLFDTRYENLGKARAFFTKFDQIAWNPDAGYFSFAFDYNNFTAKAEGSRSQWTVCTHGTRIETYRNPQKNNQWDNREVNLTEAFKTLFEEYQVAYPAQTDLREAIALRTEKAFFERLLYLIRLTLQMRNSMTGSDIDYLVSPVADPSGVFFDSRRQQALGKDQNGHWMAKLPVDADANGAYNIARKGLWVLQQIRQASDFRKMKLAISNKEWLAYVQG